MDLLGWTWFPLFVFLAVLWQAPWKGVALWKAARNRHIGWFIAIFILNTMAILEIIYIFAFSKKKPSPTVVEG